MLGKDAMELPIVGIDAYLELLSRFAKALGALEDTVAN
jgi:hypothetical protein